MKMSSLNHRNHGVDLAKRLCDIREDLYGEHAQFMADALGVPLRTWLNYESGVTVPAYVVLQLIVLARVNAHWLLTGKGEKHDQNGEQREAR